MVVVAAVGGVGGVGVGVGVVVVLVLVVVVVLVLVLVLVLVWGGPWNNTRGPSLCLQVEVVVGGGLGTTHGAPVFVCRWRLLWGGGPWNNTRGPSLGLQVEVVVSIQHHLVSGHLFNIIL